jgi:hypothetical protein
MGPIWDRTFFNIEYLANFKLQVKTLYCIRKLDRKTAFLTLVNILKMNVLGFFWQFQTFYINTLSRHWGIHFFCATTRSKNYVLKCSEMLINEFSAH